MSRSLSLAAYRVLTRRGVLPGPDDMPPRPEGELIWIHASGEARILAIRDMCQRLLSQRPGLSTMMTLPSGEIPEQIGQTTGPVLQIGSDHPAAGRRFLDHWRPDLCVWAGGTLFPNLISQAADRAIPMILLDATEPELKMRRTRWLPDPTKPALFCFDAILASSESAARYIHRLGVAPEKITVAAQLREGPNPPAWPEDELVATTNALAGRQIWLAAFAQSGEIDDILAAHKDALRRLHRLLLVIHLEEGDDRQVIKERLAEADLRYSDWDTGQEIEDTTQVIVSTVAEDLGLWYRVAPVTFMAGSLLPEARGHDPMTCVALGSALIYGPNVRGHIDIYARLAASGAARSVRDADSLGRMVVQLLAPDSAAEMALSGWQVVTEGAQLTDRLIDLIQDMLDNRRTADAGA